MCRAVHVVGMSSDATNADRHEAAVRVLARCASTVPAEARRPLVRQYLADGPFSALAWLTGPSKPAGKLTAVSRAVTSTIAVRKWGAHELAATEAGIRFLTAASPDWPAQLNELGDLAPLGLWVRGTIPDLSAGAVSIVGSRNLTATGHHHIDRAVAGLPVPVISGLATGADETAHRMALRHRAPTIAVLPSGVDNVYPPRNRQLAERIVAQGGALLSEVPPRVGVQKWRFLDRNRIIAALGTGSLIIEAGIQSGTMNEAGHARRLGRRIAAIPGTPGTDLLIADGTAHPAVSRTDIEALFEMDLMSS